MTIETRKHDGSNSHSDAFRRVQSIIDVHKNVEKSQIQRTCSSTSFSSTMNRQPNDRELNSNTNPSSIDMRKVNEPNLRVDTLVSSFYATAQASASSRLSSNDSSSLSFSDNHSSVDQQHDLVQRRMQMTEQYLLKALNLDRRLD